jgi:hypothetical protein
MKVLNIISKFIIFNIFKNKYLDQKQGSRKHILSEL